MTTLIPTPAQPAAPTAATGRLGRAGGVAVGMSSLVGAGLVGVPAALLHETGDAAIVTWLVAAVLCLPMIVLFRDAVRGGADSSDPLRDTVRAGLGRRWGDLVPLMFGMVVVVGLPVNAVIGARSLVAATGVGIPETAMVAALLGTAVLANLVGGGAGARVQQVGTVLLVAALGGFVVWALAHAEEAPDLTPAPESFGAVPVGVLLAFWAFLGFENLTFLSRDLRHPRRDFMPVALFTLALLTTLAVLLTVAVAATEGTSAVDPVTGIVDSARRLPLGGAVAAVLAGAVGAAILLNALAWTRGVGLVLSSAAREGLLPGWLAGPDPRQPRRAVLVIAIGCAVTVTVLDRFPGLVVDLLAAASAVFVVIYLICIAAYVRARGLRPSTLANLALVPVMLWSLVGSGARSLYAVAVLAVAALVVARRSGRLGPVGPVSEGPVGLVGEGPVGPVSEGPAKVPG